MNIRHACGVVAAGALTCSMAVFALPSQAAASHWTVKSQKRPITIVGCLQTESEYRRAHSLGRGGPLQTGSGDSNEYVLVNATAVTPQGRQFSRTRGAARVVPALTTS